MDISTTKPCKIHINSFHHDDYDVIMMMTIGIYFTLAMIFVHQDEYLWSSRYVDNLSLKFFFIFACMTIAPFY